MHVLPVSTEPPSDDVSVYLSDMRVLHFPPTIGKSKLRLRQMA